MARTAHPMSLARKKYSRHRAQAKFRNIGFNLSFDEWYNWWLSNGVDKNQNTRYSSDTERYCMCRIGDQGPYDLSNIYLANAVNNVKDRMKHGPRKPKSLSKTRRYGSELYTTKELTEMGIPENLHRLYKISEYDQMNQQESLRLIRRHQRDVKILLKFWTAGDLRFSRAAEAANYLGLTEEQYKARVRKGLYQKIKAPAVPESVIDYIKQCSRFPDPYIPKELLALKNHEISTKSTTYPLSRDGVNES